MRVRLALLLCILPLALVPWPMTAIAQTGFEQLASPGPLARHHEHLEKSCASCHKTLDRAAQKDLCLGCHNAQSFEQEKLAGRRPPPPIKDDIEQERGMHGLRAEARNSQCSRCHTDHKGREASIIELDWQTFDHSETNFVLAGAHRAVRCESCHKQVDKSPTSKRTQFRGTSAACVDCHQKADVHRGRLGPRCNDCHTDVAWSDRSKPFDHFQLSGFKLVGAHRLVADGGKASCASCHFGERYKGVPHETCATCHGLEDVHKGMFGAQCGLCHNQDTWKQTTAAAGTPGGVPSLAAAVRVLKTASFDHDKTRFPLVGNHIQAKCESCHKATFRNTPQNCYACHAAKDTHKGRFGRTCETCHSPVGWQKIVGTEKEAGSLAAAIRVLKEAKFDHDKTRFPLVGNHVKVDCASCHTTTFKDTARNCFACHAKSDVHKGAFGARCEICHTPASWKQIGGTGAGGGSLAAAIKTLRDARFDHSKTRFPLTGRHVRAKCESCHINKNQALNAPPRFKGTPTRCIDCHREEGRKEHGTAAKWDNCARCHSTKGW